LSGKAHGSALSLLHPVRVTHEAKLSNDAYAQPAAGANAAARALDRADVLVEEMGAGGFGSQIAETRSRLMDARGEEAEAERQLSKAQHLYAEIGAIGDAERLARELGA
jgi:hypothetical protein